MTKASTTSTTTTQKADSWNLLARMQGLVCLVCSNPPAFRRRQHFYDTGLCRACAAAIAAEPQASA